MQPFEKVNSNAAVLDIPNVDTDQIIPKQFLKRVERTGFGQFLFYDWRFNSDGSDNADFSLNRAESKGAQVLFARDNFGCGSSREHAPWALLDYGFKVIVAPSFADIFYNNCFQNGILPIALPAEQVDQLFAAFEQNPSALFEVDLEKQLISGPVSINFEIEANRKEKLLKGLDDISFTLQFDDLIKQHEESRVAF